LDGCCYCSYQGHHRIPEPFYSLQCQQPLLLILSEEAIIIFSCLYHHFLSWKWKGHQQNILTNLYVEDRAAVKYTPQITIFMCTPSYTWGQSCTYNAIYQLEEAAIAFSPAEQGTIWVPNESCNLRLRWNWIQRKTKKSIS